MTISRNFVVNRGHSFSEVIVAQKGNKNFNLENYSVKCVAREGYNHDYFKVVLETKILDAEKGIIKIAMSPSDTLGIKVSKLVYTLSVKNNNTGRIEDIMEGRLIINQTATWDSDWGE